MAHQPTDRILGASSAIVAVREQIRRLAPFDTPGNPHVPTILVQGETGTGKGLVARAIHDSGPRAGGPFVDLNCRAIPETMLEAELFGFEAGAFTDARRAKPGLFEAASGGTLFLDEIDGLPLVLQGKLLKAIEEKSVRRLGAVTGKSVDVKLVAATQRELAALVAEGGFRADLYHRLAVLVLALPPLRVRGADVVLLAERFLASYAAAHRLAVMELTPAAREWLEAQAWPGNVRELGHLMERAVLLAGEPTLDAATLQRLALTGAPPPAAPVEPEPSADEAARIRAALRRTGGNVLAAARVLGFSRNALRYRMRRLKIERPSLDEPVLEPAAREANHGGAPSIWERRIVALLVADVTFPERSVPAEPWTLAHRWAEELGRKIEGFGAVWLEKRATQMVAAFGLPRALEQMPERAAQAAQAMLKLADEARERGEPAPELRVAIHLGPLLVDAESTAAVKWLAIDDSISFAQRLLGHAAPGECLASAAVARRIAQTCHLEPRRARMGPHDVETFVVRGLRPRGGAAGIEPATMSPFVGREAELRVLEQALDDVGRGRGRVIGIVGEPGVGKSRLLGEVRRTAIARGTRVLLAQCLSYGSASPYLPIAELIRQWNGTELDVAATARPGLTPAAMKAKTFEAVRGTIVAACREGPLLLAVEDLQWIDHTSEELLTTIVDALAALPLLLVVTYRPGYVPPWLARSMQIAVPPLSDAESPRIVEAILPDAARTKARVDALVARAEGNPFFLEELARASIDRPELSPEAVPATIQGVLMARIDRLSDEPRRCLQAASVVGRVVAPELLQAIWDGPGKTAALVAELVRQEFLYEHRDEHGTSHVFRHALTQDVAYATLPADRRSALHRAAGKALEAAHGERAGEHADSIAHHFYRGEAWGEAFPYLFRSAERARLAHATVEAAQLYGRAIEVAGKAPIGEEALLPVYEGRGLIELLQSRLDDAEADFAVMLRIARAAGDVRAEGEALCHLAQTGWFRFSEAAIPAMERHAREALEIHERTGIPRIRARSLLSLGLIAQIRGNLDEADRLMETSAEIARAERFMDTLTSDLMWLGAQAHWRGDFPRALELVNEALATSREIHDGFAELLSLAFLCLSEWSVGRHREAVAIARFGIDKARERNNAFVLGRLINTLGSFHCEFGDPAGAEEHDRESFEIGRRSGVSNVEISALINLGVDALALGKPDRALSILAPALERVERDAFGAHRWRWKQRLLVALAEANEALGHRDEALRFATAGLTAAESVPCRKYIARSLGVRGRLLVGAGLVADAANDLERARAIAAEIRLSALDASLAFELGRCREASGDEAAASRLYREAKTALEERARGVGDERLAAALLGAETTRATLEAAARLG